MTSVVIPAHNEASVIGRSLSALTEGAVSGELEIVVVCNGCSDDTAGVARQFGDRVRVVETAVASKINALNLGDAEATTFPRIYLDADVVLPLASLRQLVARLEGDSSTLAAGPVPRFDTGNCPWAVRAFFEINGRLPSAREGIGGSGAYALSAAGRGRFGEFPQLIADDGFARIMFTPSERAAVAEASCTVFAPRTLRNLIAIKSRSHLGNYELAQKFPDLLKNRAKGNDRALLRMFLRPNLWLPLAVYCYVKLQARRRARRSLGDLGRWVWVRDETSRTAARERQLDVSAQHAG
jgi:glycosyltransferase involved in cell wall biosynthesis